MRKTIVLILAVVAVIAALRIVQTIGDDLPTIEVSGAESSTDNLTLQPVLFTQQDFYIWPTRVDAELGTLRVPAQRNPSNRHVGKPFELKFVRFRSVGEVDSASPIVYLAGGPGGSGIGAASGDRFSLFMKLREAGDVIALDQRGTGYSEPRPVCPAPVELPLDRVMSVGELSEQYAPVLRECFAQWSTDIHPDAFTTMESVEDLESLRLALGVERLSFVGISYGTHLALAYIRQYPDHVEKAMLAGVEGPDHTWKRPAIVDGIVHKISATLENESGWVGFTDDIELAIARLSEDMPVVAVKNPQSDETINVAIGPQDLKLAVFYGLGEREDFLDVAKRVRRIANGEYELLARYALRLRRSRHLSVMPLSMDCAAGVSDARLQQIESEKSRALIGDVANYSIEVPCREWPVLQFGREFREPVTANTAVLAISGTLDARTPPSNADTALAGFPNTHHLLIVGGAHDDDLLIASPGIGQAMVDFLISGDPKLERIELPAF